MEKKITALSYPRGTVNVFVAGEGTGRPGLVVIEEIWGVDAHIKDVCERFAKEGFAVVSPELLPEGVLAFAKPEIRDALFDPARRSDVQPKMREAMSPLQQPGFAEDAVAKLKACADYLQEHGAPCVGVVGFCFGGTYSFHLAINDDRIKAAVPFYGHPPAPDTIPHLDCPILNFNGENDANIIGVIPALEAAMKEKGNDYTNITYPDAGHAFFNDTNPRSYNKAAAEDAWKRMLEFLKAHLT